MVLILIIYFCVTINLVIYIQFNCWPLFSNGWQSILFILYLLCCNY